jgi:hypothetical protein
MGDVGEVAFSWSVVLERLLFTAYTDPPAGWSTDRFKVNVVWEEWIRKE